MRQQISARALALILISCASFLIMMAFNYERLMSEVSTVGPNYQSPPLIPCIPANELYINTTLDTHLPWYLSGGAKYPEKTNNTRKLFPYEDPASDRILAQLTYVPNDYAGCNTSEKVILFYNELGRWEPPAGASAFAKCPINRCTLTEDKRRAVDADAIMFKEHFTDPGVERPANQIWIMHFLECPETTNPFNNAQFLFNWTATYRRDSTIAAPYGKWMYYNPKIRHKEQTMNYAANKTKKVAWFVSNCVVNVHNNRMEYAQELAKHIPVDIYGWCGPLKCPRSDKTCFGLLDRDYKFYLAFENSNCRDYITEKLYVNGLAHNVLPVVMGAHPKDYKRYAPENSYIHVDDFESPADLASYLHRLDQDDTLYNSYFKWKGTGVFIDINHFSYFWCRLCAMMHAPMQYRHYADVNDWWRGPGVCTPKTWPKE